jgi:hypothetical protein
MFDFDLGYVQGMSDFLSPILVIINDEVDTFWCFVGLMKIVVSHLFVFVQYVVKYQQLF